MVNSYIIALNSGYDIHPPMIHQTIKESMERPSTFMDVYMMIFISPLKVREG